MINLFLGIAGWAIVLLVTFDIVSTALRLSGGGPFSQPVIKLLWSGLLALHRKTPSHQILSYGGLGIILVTFFLWIVFYWTGWAFIFSAGKQAVVSASTGAPGELLDRIYYVGFTMTTLGVGDYKPGEGIWQVLTVILAGNSFFLLTMIVTYLLPLTSTFVEKRKVATTIANLGRNPQELLAGMNRMGAQGMIRNLSSLSDDINRLSQGHLAYPAIYFFHSLQPKFSYPVMVTVLHEFLILVLFGTAPKQRQGFQVLSPLYHSIGAYLTILQKDFIMPASDSPPPADLASLREAGLDSVSQSEFHEALESVKENRKILLGLLRFEGWTWDDVGGNSGA